MRFGILIGALAVGSPVSAMDGRKLVTVCESSDTFEIGFCMGYIEASLAEIDDYDFLLEDCLPTDLTMGQIRDIALEFLNENPEGRQFGAGYLINISLSTKFGCPEKKHIKKSNP